MRIVRTWCALVLAAGCWSASGSPPSARPAGPAEPAEPAANANLDPDRDGVTGGWDRCPDVPEDRDGVEDSDGCPEGKGYSRHQDDDGDGIRDAVDGCPDDPEDFDTHQDEDGCPEPDNDGDGIRDV